MEKSRLLLIVASLALVSPPVAVAASVQRLEPAFGNTIVSTYPDGRTARLWLHPDGAYDGRGRRGKPSSGRWSLRGDRICLKQKKPTPSPISYCTPLPTGGVGAVWSAKAVTGEPIRVSVVKGGRS